MRQRMPQAIRYPQSVTTTKTPSAPQLRSNQSVLSSARNKEERFEPLRKFSELSLNDFFENLGMSAVITERHLNLGDINKPIKDFFNSKEFYSLCADEEFQRIYEESRSNYISLFRKYTAAWSNA